MVDPQALTMTLGETPRRAMSGGASLKAGAWAVVSEVAWCRASELFSLEPPEHRLQGENKKNSR
jgi:hypothetical protein